MDGPHGNMIHSTVPPGMVGRACRFQTIDEYWYVLSGEGEIWRGAPDGDESITRLIPGVCVDIPLGTAFQYRCTGNVPLVFTCTALPPCWRRRGRDRGRALGTPCGPGARRPALGLASRPARPAPPTAQGTFPNTGACDGAFARRGCKSSQWRACRAEARADRNWSSGRGERLAIMRCSSAATLSERSARSCWPASVRWPTQVRKTPSGPQCRVCGRE
jgi:mannose-6-phosphate isomerase-like protein (cupin superfamily)